MHSAVAEGLIRHMSRTHILIIDDHAMFRSGLRMLLNASMPEADVSEAGTLREAIDQTSVAPCVVLLDIKLPGLNGVEGIALLRRQWPEVPVLILSSQDDAETVRQVLARGATGFVSKAETAEKIVKLINQILHYGVQPSAEVEDDSAPSIRLTPRQCDVLELLCEGLSNKLIAKRLVLSENTVRWHVQAILETLKVSSRSEAAFAARQLGLVG